MKNCRRIRAFTTVEMMTGLIVIALIFAAMTMKPGSSRQSIRREAEKLAAYLNFIMQTADRYRTSFRLSLNQNSCSASYPFDLNDKENPKIFNVNPKYKLVSNFQGDEVNYSVKSNKFSQGGTITLTEISSDEIEDIHNKYYVIIAVMGGRVRTSPNPPDSWN